jgi:hypothetical protein
LYPTKLNILNAISLIFIEVILIKTDVPNNSKSAPFVKSKIFMEGFPLPKGARAF